MAALVALGCALLSCAATFVLLSHGAREGRAGEALLAAHAARRRIVAVAEALATSALVARLTCRDDVGALCDVVCERAARRGATGGTRERACAALLMSACAAALACALLSRSPVGLAVVPLACVVGVPAWNAARDRRMAQELSSEMPGVFRALATALGSGETLSQAIEYVGLHEEGPAGRAFTRTALRLRCGSSVEDALAALSRELEAPGVGMLVSALLISQRTGSPLRGLFEQSATLVERAREFERMLEVKTAQVRLSVRIVCLLPLVMLLGLSMISADFQRGLSTGVGMASVCVAAAMDLMALAIIRRLMRGVL